MQDDTTLKYLKEVKQWLFDLDGNEAHAEIVKIPRNYAIKIVQDTITPEDAGKWDTWHLGVKLSKTSDNRIQVLLTSLPIAVLERRRKAEAKHATESVEDIVRQARAVP